jgi:hypothetical protein
VIEKKKVKKKREKEKKLKKLFIFLLEVELRFINNLRKINIFLNLNKEKKKFLIKK